MPYRITYTKRFQKHFRSVKKKKKEQIRSKVRILATDPLHPSLRTKKIKGTENLFECSVNMDIRIVWYYEDDQLILLLDVGHHDIMDKY